MHEALLTRAQVYLAEGFTLAPQVRRGDRLGLGPGTTFPVTGIEDALDGTNQVTFTLEDGTQLRYGLAEPVGIVRQ